MTAFKFGFVPFPADALSAVDASILAERCGFDSVWMPDAFVDVSQPAGVNPWVVLAAIAAKTNRIMLGTGVTDTQRSHPSRTAQLVATLDVISHGRARLGIGAGEAMHVAAFGLPWESPRERISRLDETIRIIRLLWKSSARNPMSFDGKYYHLSNAFLGQSPKQKLPPIYIGIFHSRRGLELVGREGDGWYSWLNTPQTFSKCWQVIKEAAESVSRNPRKIEPWSNLMVAFPRNAKEDRRAILSAKMLLLVERSVLISFGYVDDSRLDHHQNVMASSESVHMLMRRAKCIPDEMAYRATAIGVEEMNVKIEEFAKAGLRNFAIADLLAPKTMKASVKICEKIIRSYM
ncbi:MAG TPA: LLM class flavin-dependent oxidoreductase [Candidatus Bathyarchaeia archaeon]|nr:LLM class flavin-dependent oxidoreductase [Candidatus Bathyarchaeia archaeon]